MRISSCFAPLLLASAALPAADLAPQHTLASDGARVVLAIATAYAQSHGAPGGAIAVVDAGGTLVSFDRLEGTFPAASDVSIGKARTAALFRKATRDFEKIVNGGRVTMTTLPGIVPFTPLQGGVPIVVDGQVVGAIGVSGASSAQQDDEIAQAAADGFAQQRAVAAPTTNAVVEPKPQP